jgi:hypothetical protein
MEHVLQLLLKINSIFNNIKLTKFLKLRKFLHQCKQETGLITHVKPVVLLDQIQQLII